jgi:hypothetical protein
MQRSLSIVVVLTVLSLYASAAPKSLSVTVVGADSSDPRWAAVEEAVAFWNQELAQAGVDMRLAPVTHLVQPVPDEALRQLSEAILGGRWEREIPRELQPIPGDILVALAHGDFISFGLRWSRDRKGWSGCAAWTCLRCRYQTSCATSLLTNLVMCWGSGTTAIPLH